MATGKERILRVRSRGMTAAVGLVLVVVINASGLSAADEPSKAREPNIDTLIELLKDPELVVRYHAAHKLGQMGAEAERAVPALARAMDDEEPLVRGGAATALGTIGAASKSHAAAAALIRSARSDKDSSVRMLAVGGLGEIGMVTKDVVPTLLAALRDESEVVRTCAGLALMRIGPEAKDAVPALIKALRDKTPEVRYWAAAALAVVGPAAKDAAPELEKLAQTVRPQTPITSKLQRTEAQIGAWAAFALYRVTGSSGKAVPLLLKVLAQLERDRDAHALVVMGMLGGMGADAKAAIPMLERLRRTSQVVENGSVVRIGPGTGKACAADALALIRAPAPRTESIKALRNATTAEHEKRAFEGIRGLGEKYTFRFFDSGLKEIHPQRTRRWADVHLVEIKWDDGCRQVSEVKDPANLTILTQ